MVLQIQILVNLFAFANAITVQPADGKVLITGASASTGGNDITIVRYGNSLDPIDFDGDGFTSDEDCDDTNASINPDADEIPYNGIDDDCNPLTPDDDLDGDGFLMADDCNDMDATINPDAVEIPNNDIDEDCDGSDLMVGLQESILSQQFTIYPNPAEQMLFLNYDANINMPELITITKYSTFALKK